MNENANRIRIEHSTVFNTNANVIVNAVNCIGVMGTGIALEFKLRYPEMYDDYKIRCDNQELKICTPYIFKYKDEINILNFPTKQHWKYPSKIEWIDKGLEHIVREIIKNKGYYDDVEIKSIAFPKLGCGKGGLSWDDVKSIMEKHLKSLAQIGIEVYLCLDEDVDPKGIEASMISIVKILNKDTIKKIGLNKNQSEVLIERVDVVNRFWELSKFLNKDSYEKIFKYCYNIVTECQNEATLINDEFKQINIDDIL